MGQRARDIIMLAEAPAKTATPPNFLEMGSRLDDLEVGSDGKLQNDDDISLETYKKMRRDPQVKACLLVLKLPIIQVAWTVQADTEDGQKIARWIEARLQEMDDSMQYYIREMLTALDFGYSISEKVWQLKTVPTDPDEENSKMEPRIVPLKVKTYHPQSLTLVLDAVTAKLRGVIQRQKNGKEVEIPADKLLIYSHEKEFGNYYGEAALRAAYKPWIIKEFLQKFWNIALERFGQPFASMTMPQGGDLKKAIDLMGMIKGKAGVPLPEGYELEIHNLANTGMSFKEAIMYQDTQIARSMLIPDLVFGNNGDSGAYALSKTHAAFFLLRLNGITQEIGDMLTSYLIKPMVRYNFGEVSEFPKFIFSDVAEEDQAALVNMVKELLIGKIIAPSETWIRERLGLPQADADAQEYLDKQKEIAMSGLENIQLANQTKGGNVPPDGEDPKGKKKPPTSDPEDDKKKQDKLQLHGEEIEDYVGDLRRSLRGIMTGIERAED